MTVTEAADLLHQDPQTVRYWITTRKLIRARRPKSNKSGRWQIMEAEFLRFVEEELEMRGAELEQMRAAVAALPPKPRRAPRGGGEPPSPAVPDA